MSQIKTDNRPGYREAIDRSRDWIGGKLGAETPTGRVTITVPNYLTLGRLASVPLFLYAFYSGTMWLQIAGTLLFALAAISDLWDGKIARRLDQVTAFGDFMDPFADKVLTLSGFWAMLLREDFGQFEFISIIWVLIITLREIALTLLRVKSIQGGSSLVTSIWGKWKTGVQLTSLLFGLTAFNVRDILIGEGISISHSLTEGLFLIMTVMFFVSAATSVVSGWLYLNLGKKGSRTNK